MTTRVEIKPEQLPEALRPLLEQHTAAQTAAHDAHRRLTATPYPNRGPVQEEADKAGTAAREAHTALLEGTREHPLEMRQYAHARFASSIERAREHLQAAEAELRAAAGHAAVHGSVRDGRPTVNAERGAESPGKKAALFSVGLVRDAADSLPDSIG
ncbi:hypothetical protein [Streptomyces sp. NPDC005283]|uniref:hypothetical protein n=1 Tax=Streptomyces sp. NPDC005283 TaxID=3156871 RepID=UPI003454F8A4